MNIAKASKVTLLCGAALLAACSGSSGSSVEPAGQSAELAVTTSPASSAPNLGPIESVQHMQNRLGAGRPLKQAPAVAAFAALKSSFAAGTHHGIRLAVYDLAPVGDVSARANARALSLGFKASGASFRTAATGFVTVAGNGPWELTIDPENGGEFFVDPSRHHKGAETNNLLTDDVYVQKAGAYAGALLPALAGGHTWYATQVHHFHNTSVEYAVGGDPTTRGAPVDGIYEISVVHNTAIDGLPVVGPGGKFKVWMSPAGGEVLAHKSSIRALAGQRVLLTGDQLKDPAAAQTDLESQLAARGVHLDQYDLTESQFGYLRRDNGAMQNVVAPHYVFVYTSRVPGQKSIVETVPAVADPTVLADIVADEQAEAARHPAAVADAEKVK